MFQKVTEACYLSLGVKDLFSETINCQYFSFHTTAGIKKMLSQIRPFFFPIVLQWNFKIAKQHKKNLLRTAHSCKEGGYLLTCHLTENRTVTGNQPRDCWKSEGSALSSSVKFPEVSLVKFPPNKGLVNISTLSGRLYHKNRYAALQARQEKRPVLTVHRTNLLSVETPGSSALLTYSRGNEVQVKTSGENSQNPDSSIYALSHGSCK